MTEAECTFCQHAHGNPERVFVALGSNLDSPLNQLNKALHTLNTHTYFHLVAVSCWYESAAVGPEQPDYLNGVCELTVSLCPEHLLETLQRIENTQNRKRLEHWGPRTLDLDILLYGERTIHTQTLTVPHAFIKERNFVIIPLYEIAPRLILPDGTKIEQLASQLGMQGLKRTNLPQTCY